MADSPLENKSSETSANKLLNETSGHAASNTHLRGSSFSPEEKVASHPTDITAGFRRLIVPQQEDNGFPLPQELTAHLKLLECFYRLKQSIASRDGLFDISSRLIELIAQSDKTDDPELLVKLAEKRWAIYLQRAVDRFEAWCRAVIPTARMTTCAILNVAGGAIIEPDKIDSPIVAIGMDNMPPVDVLMIWHTYMLNPRTYLEDCIRSGRMPLWHCSLPWQAVADCIDSVHFKFDPGFEAENAFKSLTGLEWDNEASEEMKGISCPRCSAILLVPWTTCFSGKPKRNQAPLEISKVMNSILSSGTGFCDKRFLAQCEKCDYYITHASLEAGKFCNDLKALSDRDVPLRGTSLGNTRGLPRTAFGAYDSSFLDASVANYIARAGMAQAVVEAHRVCPSNKPMKMQDIRKLIEGYLRNEKYLKGISCHPLRKPARLAIRRMLSRYWFNSSPFGIDLVGATLRQAVFIEKMHHINWLHSPALSNTANRIVLKYSRFMSVIKKYPTNTAVPTLDVDLGWHTHQLSPYRYMAFTVKLTGTFVNHNDKIAETKLNKSFQWTSKVYEKMFHARYAQCTCWYCEAVQESHTSISTRLFYRLSINDDPTRQRDYDPDANAHLSSHDAVRPSYDYSIHSEQRQLEAHYQKACERAKKSNRPVPPREDYYWSDAYGHPVYLLVYSPFIAVAPVTAAYYPVDPSCIAMGTGQEGNCCEGTCGGGVAAGGCGHQGTGDCAGTVGGGDAGWGIETCGSSSGGCGGCGGCGD